MKALKIIQIIGIILLCFGMVRACGGAGMEYDGASTGVIGLLMYTVARLIAWVKSDKVL